MAVFYFSSTPAPVARFCAILAYTEMRFSAKPDACLWFEPLLMAEVGVVPDAPPPRDGDIRPLSAGILSPGIMIWIAFYAYVVAGTPGASVLLNFYICWLIYS